MGFMKWLELWELRACFFFFDIGLEHDDSLAFRFPMNVLLFGHGIGGGVIFVAGSGNTTFTGDYLASFGVRFHIVNIAHLLP